MNWRVSQVLVQEGNSALERINRNMEVISAVTRFVCKRMKRVLIDFRFANIPHPL